jgi:quercetin dioxygenase-like cupin family protein
LSGGTSLGLIHDGLVSDLKTETMYLLASNNTPVSGSNFTGTVTPRGTTDIRTNRYHFDPGARTKWHSHEGGQVIYVEEGRLRVQEKGKATHEFEQGATFHVAPGITHWHGAPPSAGSTQISLSFGMTNWMEPVSDQDYKR